MITIALDETGDFEGIEKNKKKPVLIAGFLFDESDDPVGSKENLRIEAYYRHVLAEASAGSTNPGGFIYPAALHSNGDKSRDHLIISKTKEIVRETFPEFIQKGTYREKSLSYVNNTGSATNFGIRKSKYYPFVIFKSDNGMDNLLIYKSGVSEVSSNPHPL